MSETSRTVGVEHSSLFAEWSQRFTKRLNRTDLPESGIIILKALIVGVGAGLGAVVFRRLIEWIYRLSFVSIAGFLEPIALLQYILIPAIGGLIVGLLIYNFAHCTTGDKIAHSLI